MNYQEIIEELVSHAIFQGTKSGLENIQAISKILGNPERKFRSVHVAGTNGKGSVCLKIAKALEAGGYRCGLFTSPHLSSFRERIKINNQLISEESVAKNLTKLFEIANKEGVTLTYFEYCTLLAFQYFAQENIDIAVIEVGLGGRLDATNIITPLLSVITSISQDHVEILGATEEEIAKEKAGIIKFQVPVVIGPRVPLKIISVVAEECKAALHRVAGDFAHYGCENSEVAKKALQILQPLYPALQIDKGLLAEPSCRFERVPISSLERSPFKANKLTPVILDVAHNKDGFDKLVERVKTVFPDRPIHFLISLSKSKDIPACTDIIQRNAKTIHILDSPHPRLAPPEKIKEFLLEGIINAPEKALHLAFQLAKENELLIICGSFFVMSPIREILGYQEARDIFCGEIKEIEVPEKE